MPEHVPIVIVVDDDVSFRRSTERLIRLAGYEVKVFGSAADFLRAPRPDAPACLVLDVCLPGLSGLELQQEMTRGAISVPIVFITAHGDVRTSVQAMKGGAVEFLTKPFSDHDLLSAIEVAIHRDRIHLAHQARLESLTDQYRLLTPREREVMACVVAGMLNKQIAAQLGTTEKTVKFHRGHLMQKMRAQSVPDLVRMASSLEDLDVKSLSTGPRSSSNRVPRV